MTRYLDIGVVQIQAWLAQAPTLKGRRGASSMIRTATAPARIAAVLDAHPGIETNREQGPIDGVVSMTVADGADIDAVTDAVLGRLREQLPTATLRVTRSTGPTYGQRVTESSRAWPAAVPEWPLGRPCAWCRVFPATEISDPDDTRRRGEPLCADCRLRHTHAGAAHSRRTPPGPERDLLERLGGDRTAPDDFAQLARLGLGPAGDDTHVAVIYADGNALGRFIAAIAASDPALLAELPDRIHAATWSAVLAGLGAIDTGQATLPVIAHLVGGDDILLSVPAHGVWDFLTAMSAAFMATITRAHPRVPDPPTLSAGVVIHHRSFPFDTVVDLAAGLLRAAKAARPGEAMVAWHSVTHDGDEPCGRPAFATTTLVEQGRDLSALAALAGSQRQELAWLLRPGNAADTDLTTQLTRLGLDTVTRPFLDAEDGPAAGVGLAQALDMVRWWRA